MAASDEYLQSCQENPGQNQEYAIRSGRPGRRPDRRLRSRWRDHIHLRHRSFTRAGRGGCLSSRQRRARQPNPRTQPDRDSTEVSKSEFLERLEGFAPHILNYHGVSREDVLIIISNSGRNAVPVDMAIEAQSRGIPVVAVTSMAYSREVSSRHTNGKKLYEVADIVIDNCTPYGDAVVNLPGLAQPVGPLSTVAGAALLHAVMVGVAERLAGKMSPVPVFWSGNLDGVTEKNYEMMAPYRARVRFW